MFPLTLEFRHPNQLLAKSKSDNSVLRSRALSVFGTFFLGLAVYPVVINFVKYMLVLASFTEIKTGYRGFEMNKIRYFVCLLLAVIISRWGIHEPELKTGNGFHGILKRM